MRRHCCGEEVLLSLINQSISVSQLATGLVFKESTVNTACYFVQVTYAVICNIEFSITKYTFFLNCLESVGGEFDYLKNIHVNLFLCVLPSLEYTTHLHLRRAD